MEDMLEQTNEVMDVLGKPYGLPDDVDEDDLEAGTCVARAGCVWGWVDVCWWLCGCTYVCVHVCVCARMCVSP